MEHPAIWRACETPSVIVFQQGARGAKAILSAATAVGIHIANQATNSSGRHIIFQGRGSRHRILIKPEQYGLDSGFVVQHDQWSEIRISAIRSFNEALHNKGTEIGRPVTGPTDHQRQRLELLLKILDSQFLPDGNRLTLRQVAQTIIYPRSDLGRAIEWKSSSERRQTQRFVQEALHLMHDGYKELLQTRTRTSMGNLK